MENNKLIHGQFVTLLFLVLSFTTGQQICNSILDMGILMDSSGSIGASNWILMKQFVTDILSNTQIGLDEVRVSLTRFGNGAEVMFHLNRYDTKQEVIDAVQQVSYLDEKTNTYDGLWQLVNEVFVERAGDRPNAPNLAIVITDGEYSGDSSRLVEPAEALKNKARVIAIGITNGILNETLNLIATYQSDVLRVEEFPDLSKLLNDISQIQCSILTTTTTTAIPTTVSPRFSSTQPTTSTDSPKTTSPPRTSTPPANTPRRTTATAPPTTLPRTTVPSTTIPPTTQPRTTEPRTTLPRTTLQPTTQQRTTEPRTTLPRTTLQPTTQQRTSEPSTALPRITSQPTTQPRNTEPRTTIPRISVPPTTIPRTTTPIPFASTSTTTHSATLLPTTTTTPLQTSTPPTSSMFASTTTAPQSTTTKPSTTQRTTFPVAESSTTIPSTTTTTTSNSTVSSTTTTTTEARPKPGKRGIITGVSPNYGPVAGGTLVEVTGKHLTPFYYDVILSSGTANLENATTSLQCQVLSGNQNSFIIKTPAYVVTHDEPPTALQVIVYDKIFWETIDVLDNFTYRPDPIVSYIYDRDTILAGGTSVQVVGESLDAVNKPVMVTKMVYTKYIDSAEIEIDITEYETICKVKNSTNMECPTPQIDLPKGFGVSSQRRKRAILLPSSFIRKRYQQGQTNRKRRQTSDDVDGLVVNDETLEFYIGIRFDGLDVYEDLRNTSLDEYSYLKVYTNPEFIMFPGSPPVIDFTPGTNQSVSVQGSRLRGGVDIDDYIIHIGLGRCHNLSLLENALSCYPPDIQPSLAPDDTQADNMPGFVIQVGNFHHRAGYVRYTPPDYDYLTVVIVISVVAAVFFIIAAVVTALIGHKFCRYRAAYVKMKKNMDDTHSTS